jgi:RNA polymerase sigma-70 factor (ECF subfamily)
VKTGSAPAHAHDQDAELLVRLRTDPDALEVFYRSHVSDVARFVARRVSSADAVADVVSNTFLAAIKGADGFDPERSPTTARYWLLGIARREVANHYGSSGRDDRLAEREGGRRRLSDDETVRIDELIDAQRLAPEIESALESLSPNVREAFVLVALDGVPQSAAAKVLGISHSALRARLTRARLHLRRRLEATQRSELGHLTLAAPPSSGGTHGL